MGNQEVDVCIQSGKRNRRKDDESRKKEETDDSDRQAHKQKRKGRPSNRDLASPTLGQTPIRDNSKYLLDQSSKYE